MSKSLTILALVALVLAAPMVSDAFQFYGGEDYTEFITYTQPNPGTP